MKVLKVMMGLMWEKVDVKDLMLRMVIGLVVFWLVKDTLLALAEGLQLVWVLKVLGVGRILKVLEVVGQVVGLGISSWLGVKWIGWWLLPVGGRVRGRVMVVVAHADDESMFFGPLVDQCLDLVLVVCTDGSLGGCAEVRRKEMELVAKDLGCKVYFLNRRDGSLEYSEEIVAEIVELGRREGIEEVVSFDEEGVSGHSDHIACSRIAYQVGLSLGLRRVYQLQSLPLPGKYGTVFSFWADSGLLIKTESLRSILKTRERMCMHRSQLLWFRYLYIIFSTYMDVNILVPRVFGTYKVY
ncbi:N-acetylglucosaminylphosphatidylinositol deacetylase [Nematocida homosporus]|uniref:N-acetylglucosaminylphosphatidylinositol deacetylase n=1 Tax=Nematocida homosporus TaxID=1912981 RepID=UPI0022205186|nr:N-acetylglucosaminylphosphatidylinositol deacetylase [Nematocida homosporus]KAI5186534.1 N-acetylglucosaminylphosphatidylinositol deacetylase [Nematocida homosporus]